MLVHCDISSIIQWIWRASLWHAIQWLYRSTIRTNWQDTTIRATADVGEGLWTLVYFPWIELICPKMALQKWSKLRPLAPSCCRCWSPRNPVFRKSLVNSTVKNILKFQHSRPAWSSRYDCIKPVNKRCQSVLKLCPRAQTGALLELKIADFAYNYVSHRFPLNKSRSETLGFHPQRPVSKSCYKLAVPCRGSLTLPLPQPV
jgi:hypothetical protein